jgi:hypothetical protein
VPWVVDCNMYGKLNFQLSEVKIASLFEDEQGYVKHTNM